MSTFSSMSLPSSLGHRVDVASDMHGAGVRISITDPEWSTAPGDGCTLVSTSEAREIAAALIRAADWTDRS